MTSGIPPYQQQQHPPNPPDQQQSPQQHYQQQYQGQPYQQQAGENPYAHPPQQPASTSEGGFLLPNTQLGLQIGTQMINVGQDYVNKNISPYIPYAALKTYFNVTNMYVLKKLLIILFPFGHKSWQRLTMRDAAGTTTGFKPPREDLNSPDLYIPAMAAVTYVLLVGFVLGLRKSFHPEQLGITATGAVIFIVCELALVKLGAYLLSLGNDVSILDMLSIIGYNFVPLIVTLLADLFLGRLAKYLAFAYCSIAMGFFMLRSLRYSFLPESNAPLMVTQRRTRVHFLFGVVAVQILCSYFLLV